VNKCGTNQDGTCSGGFCCKVTGGVGSCTNGKGMKTACGSSGFCRDCTNSSTGTVCLQIDQNTYRCGCNNRKEDCLAANPGAGLPGYACESATKSCVSVCGVQGVSNCNGGCCSGPNGTCRVGNQNASCGVSGGFCLNCSGTCAPGPLCDLNTGACVCVSSVECLLTAPPAGKLQGPACDGRSACNAAKRACCIPGGPTMDPALCCSGMAVNGQCTCVANGDPPVGNSDSCCTAYATGGKCACRPSCAGPGTPPFNCTTTNVCHKNSDCCSGKCAADNYVQNVCRP
jgi:hypothetical protein